MTVAKTLVLAPHSDDAAFSVGGLIVGRHLPGAVTVLTLFGRSNYSHGRFHKDFAKITEIRRKEDEAWTGAANTGLIWLDAPEAALRLGSNFQAIFGPADHMHQAVRGAEEAVKAFAKTEPHTLIIAPLAIGGHCDHVVTRDIAKSIARDQKILTVFYEELPYAYEAAAEDIAEAAKNALSDPIPIVVGFRPDELDAKCSSLSMYSTQIENSVLHAVRQQSLSLNALHGGERIWIDAADYRAVEIFT